MGFLILPPREFRRKHTQKNTDFTNFQVIQFFGGSTNSGKFNAFYLFEDKRDLASCIGTMRFALTDVEFFHTRAYIGGGSLMLLSLSGLVGNGIKRCVDILSAR